MPAVTTFPIVPHPRQSSAQICGDVRAVITCSSTSNCSPLSAASTADQLRTCSKVPALILLALSTRRHLCISSRHGPPDHEPPFLHPCPTPATWSASDATGHADPADPPAPRYR